MLENNYPFPEDLKKIRNELAGLIGLMESGSEGDLYAFATLDDMNIFDIAVRETESINNKLDRGIVLRIVYQGRNYESSTNDLSRENLKKLATELRERVIKSKAPGSKEIPPYNPQTWQEVLQKISDPYMEKVIGDNWESGYVHFSSPYDRENEYNFNPGKLAEYGRNLNSRIRKLCGDTISTTGCMIHQKVKTKLFVDRHRNMSQALVSTRIVPYTVSKKGLQSYRVIGGLIDFTLTDEITEDLISRMASEPALLDSAERLETGRYRIITSPAISGVIAHEAFGHTQEGDTCRYGRSCAPGLKKSNTRIGNDQADIINNAAVFTMDGRPYGQNGSHFFDDEGELAREQVLLDRGYLSSPMNDLLSSLHGDINGKSPRQSNGKRESWRRPIMARQTNTFFTPGDKSLDELIALMGDGYIASLPHGGMEDPKGMGLTAGAAFFEEVKNGKRTGKVLLGPQGGHIELTDPVPRILNGIMAKSSNHDNPYNQWGGCGKYHKEGVEAGVGGPWILWEGINCG